MQRGILIAFILLLVAPAQAQLREVGLVNLVSGDVRFAPVNGAAAPVEQFMRVREGDRFNLATGAQLRVVFFEGARLERWFGPSSFRAARAQAEAIAGAATEIARLPAAAPQRIARIPELVQNAKLGAAPARAAAPAARPAQSLVEMRATYAQMKRTLPPDDIAPELYYYAALEEHARYDEMRAVVAEMQRKQPGSADVQALAEWLRKKTEG
ncbi:MAG: hypothetical protein R3357_05555 [Burkholderiales bacterium]|nr:hypothetical protein [Burkholderiales bacterium]